MTIVDEVRTKRFVLEDDDGNVRASPPQFTFHQARENHRRRWFVAGIQSGMIEAGALEAFLFATKYRPGGRGAIFGPDFPKAIEARDRFNQMGPYELRTWNGSERVREDPRRGRQGIDRLLAFDARRRRPPWPGARLDVAP